MVTVHSFLPDDANFGLIEAANHKKHRIYVTGDLEETIMNAKRKFSKFDATEVKNFDLFSTIVLEKSNTNRK